MQAVAAFVKWVVLNFDRRIEGDAHHARLRRQGGELAGGHLGDGGVAELKPSDDTAASIAHVGIVVAALVARDDHADGRERLG